ncbi:hypothetical protein [Gimesia panareensis]|uniref:Cytochrome C n=1 Tax=Gimesia panareensis TaxID=2527978 RepID=A0A517QD28_9PLAN|nr:hypothetical protein [Gimesia panareensis]QDT29538.1 hypothetical protein Enr10x_48930 [Gimesia panareensis]QDU52581.1 hypothetical protein Pan110_49610 [Gimesia panareensis]QDV20355.1 hypothetical protein Pan153_50300 [Gimesia panareensis]
MNMTQRWLLLATGILLIAGGVFASDELRKSAADPDEQQAALMLAKLASCQKITNGLVTKDFKGIHSGAKALSQICIATEWASHDDPVYAHHRMELRKQAQKLAKMAEEKNLDGSTYAYMHSLNTCINCHEYCRDVLSIVDDSEVKLKVVPIPSN